MLRRHTRPLHLIERVRQEPKRRALTVIETRMISLQMRRIVFTSPDLHDFDSPAPDDHVKLFFPDPQNGEAMIARDYTPRAFDAQRGVLAIDFALHENGIATSWARQAKEGDHLLIGGPRGSLIVPDDFDWYLLIGDETAFPAIARRLETLRRAVPVTSFLLIDTHEDMLPFKSHADHEPHWLMRAGSELSDEERLLAALAKWCPPKGDGYVWIGAEAKVAKAAKRHMLEERGHNPSYLKAAGYWVKGEPGGHEKL